MRAIRSSIPSAEPRSSSASATSRSAASCRTKWRPARIDVVVQSPPCTTVHAAPKRTLRPKIEPCRRYYINAQFDNPHRARMDAGDRSRRDDRGLQHPDAVNVTARASILRYNSATFFAAPVCASATRARRAFASSSKIPLAPHADQACRLQVVRRSDVDRHARANSSASSVPTAAASPTSSMPCAGCSANRRHPRCAASRCRTSSSTAPASARPIGRASVELFFDNSQGRIGGQWGQYAELSIKRMLTRDGDSTYYINNIPVRRRDIHDLFLGTGLGPRAYAIIEQGMISRVIEAKPEELRIFLEEAAGVSKYKERRRETEGRLADTRENLVARRGHPAASSATSSRGSRSRPRSPRNTASSRTRHRQCAAPAVAREGAGRGARARALRTRDRRRSPSALEALQADVRSAENQLVTLRDQHFAAGDALHDKQGAFYAANAEVTRLEQQLAFARENETRLTEQVAQLTEAIGALDGPAGGARRGAGSRGARRSKARSLRASARRPHEAQAQAGCRRSKPPSPTPCARFSEIAAADRADRAGRARRRNAARQRGAGARPSITERRERLAAELAQLAAPATDPCVGSRRSSSSRKLRSLRSKPATRRRSCKATVQSLQERQRGVGERVAGCEQAARRPRGARGCAVGAAGEDRPRQGHRRVARGARPHAREAAVAGGRHRSRAGKTRSRPCCASGSTRSTLRDLDDALAWVAEGDTAAGTPRRLRDAADGARTPRCGDDALLREGADRKRPGVAPRARRRSARRALPPPTSPRRSPTARRSRRGETFVTPEGHRVSAHRRCCSSRPTANCTACWRASAN